MFFESFHGIVKLLYWWYYVKMHEWKILFCLFRMMEAKVLSCLCWWANVFPIIWIYHLSKIWFLIWFSFFFLFIFVTLLFTRIISKQSKRAFDYMDLYIKQTSTLINIATHHVFCILKYLTNVCFVCFFHWDLLFKTIEEK